METHLIAFEHLLWIESQKGIRYKIFQSGDQQLRLAEFSEEFEEDGWCCRGHAGYVIEGVCQVDFNDSQERFCAGDVFFIPEGEGHKHRLTVDKGQKFLTLLFESV